MPENYKVGQRTRKFGENHQMAESRFAWVQVEGMKFVILVGEDKGSGSDVILFHPKPGKQPDVTIPLSSLTEPELVALKDLFDSAFEWALPVVKQRDKEAQDAWEKGDDSYLRNYRAVPTLVYRKRPSPEHGQSIQHGSEGIFEGGGGGGEGDDGRVRGAGDELAESDSLDSGPQDDGSSPD